MQPNLFWLFVGIRAAHHGNHGHMATPELDLLRRGGGGGEVGDVGRTAGKRRGIKDVV